MNPETALNATEAAARMRAGRLAAHEYLRPFLDRIAAREGEIQAWVDFDAGRALRLAEACEAVEDRTELPLYGIPVGVKDIIDTADLPTQCGSSLYAGRRPERDAEVVQRLKRAGAYVMGKTVTAEMAFMHPGPTRNPRHPGHTPGGSSSGSAAAVAAGFVPLALGTQTNGSIVRPAAYCGVVGIKPTAGSVPGGGCLVFSSTLDQLGAFARDVDDAALITSVLVADDQLIEQVRAPLGRAPRLLALRRFPWNEAEPDAARHFEETLDRLRAGGAEIEEIALPDALAEAKTVHRTIMLYEAAREHAEARVNARDRLSATLAAALDEGAAMSADAYREALAARAAMMESARDLFEDRDAVLSPSAPGAAPAGLHATGDPSFATLWSLLGFPALSLPSGRSAAGLPFGLQIAASAGEDALLLRVAKWCETQLARYAASS
nr:MAG: amidase [Pseudomonadota bacterium]